VQPTSSSGEQSSPSSQSPSPHGSIINVNEPLAGINVIPSPEGPPIYNPESPADTVSP
jgi:hypothetical protein